MKKTKDILPQRSQRSQRNAGGKEYRFEEEDFERSQRGREEKEFNVL